MLLQMVSCFSTIPAGLCVLAQHPPLLVFVLLLAAQFDHAPPKGAGITEVKRTVPEYFL